MVTCRGNLDVNFSACVGGGGGVTIMYDRLEVLLPKLDKIVTKVGEDERYCTCPVHAIKRSSYM